MKNKEFEIGSTIQFGLLTLKVEENKNNDCFKCHLENYGCYNNMVDCVGFCHAENRKDKKNVIFVKIKKPL